jgi:hypothetical protein
VKIFSHSFLHSLREQLEQVRLGGAIREDDRTASQIPVGTQTERCSSRRHFLVFELCRIGSSSNGNFQADLMPSVPRPPHCGRSGLLKAWVQERDSWFVDPSLDSIPHLSSLIDDCSTPLTFLLTKMRPDFTDGRHRVQTNGPADGALGKRRVHVGSGPGGCFRSPPS